MSWTKEADWIPVSNALAQVIFWKKDLKQAIDFMNMLDTMGVSPDNEMYEIGYEDLEVSRDGLLKAKAKLKETLKRVRNG